MKRKRAAWLVLWLLLVFFITPKDTRAGRHSVAVKIGYHHFLDSRSDSKPDGDGVLEDGEFDGDIEKTDFNSLSAEGEYNLAINRVFSIAFSVQWYGGQSTFTTVEEGARVSGDMTMSITGFLVTPMLRLPLGPIALGAGAGPGMYWLARDFAFTIDRSASKNRTSSTDADTRLGYHVQAGLGYAVADWMEIFLEDRLAYVLFHGRDPNTDFDRFNGGGNTLFLGSRFRF